VRRFADILTVVLLAVLLFFLPDLLRAFFGRASVSLARTAVVYAPAPKKAACASESCPVRARMSHDSAKIARLMALVTSDR